MHEWQFTSLFLNVDWVINYDLIGKYMNGMMCMET